MSVLSFFLLILTVASAANWAVLVCGSEGFDNYRHHADISHAYQILKRGGFDADHIITMMYNDVPFDEFVRSINDINRKSNFNSEDNRNGIRFNPFRAR